MKILNFKQQGMTITELMIAVTLGLIVSAAVAGLFLQTTASNNQNEEITYIQDNGRYALKVLADDLEMSNFWAGLSASNRTSISIDNATASQNTIYATIKSDVNTLCNNAEVVGAGSTNWNYDFEQPISYMKDVTEAGALAAYPCIDNSDNSLAFLDGRNVLMIKRTKGFEESSGQTDGAPYIRGNRTVATLHQYDKDNTAAPPTGFFDWKYINHIYYSAQDASCTSKCVPKLVRQSLQQDPTDPNAQPTYVTEEIADGIEGFHVMFGIDTNTDGVVDTFTSTPSDTEILNAIVAKLYVVARSESEIVGYTNDKTYVVGDISFTPTSGGVVDHYYRRVFSTTVVMKNTEAVVQMAAM